MASRVTLTLMRHLPTEANLKKQYIGWTDESIASINPEIRFQMPWTPKKVVGSDLRRCQESAALYFPQASYHPNRRFREAHFGEWEMKTYDQLKDNGAYRSWLDDSYAHHPPGGETLGEVEQRVMEGLSDLTEAESDHFVVTHGGPIRILLTRLSPEPSSFWSWQIPHGSAWRLEWDSVEDWKGGKRCASLSEVPITANVNTFGG
ncbi:histidine phosphatase family protein [Sporosarcina sp. CAU 1771]